MDWKCVNDLIAEAICSTDTCQTKMPLLYHISIKKHLDCFNCCWKNFAGAEQFQVGTGPGNIMKKNAHSQAIPPNTHRTFWLLYSFTNIWVTKQPWFGGWFSFQSPKLLLVHVSRRPRSSSAWKLRHGGKPQQSFISTLWTSIWSSSYRYIASRIPEDYSLL